VAVALCCVLGGLLVGVAASAAIEIEPASARKTAAPGAFITHVFSVRNTGATAIAVVLSTEIPGGWSLLGAPSTLDIAAGAEETVFLTLTVPAGALAGTYDLTLIASSSDDPPDVVASTVQTSIAPVNEVEIVAAIGGSVAPGSTYTYSVSVVNRGNAHDTLSVTASSSHGYAVDPSSTTLTLAPQERATLSITLEVPTEASSGRDLLTVNAQSTLYDGVSDQITIFTTILPPSPDAVGGLLIEELPTHLRLSMDKDVLTGAFTSYVSLSVYGNVGDGIFAASFSGDSPLGSSAFSVASYSLQIERDPTSFRIGNVSRRLTELLLISCEGGNVAIEQAGYSAAFVGGFTDGEARAAGQTAVRFSGIELAVTYLGLRTEADKATNALTATLESEPFTDWLFRTERGFAVTNSGIESAFSLVTEYDGAAYFLRGHAFSAGAGFPSSFADRTGLRIMQRLVTDALSLSLSLGHERTNWIDNPIVDTLITDAFGLSFSAAPIDDGPELMSIIEFEWNRHADPASLDEIDVLLTCSIAQNDGLLPFSVSGTVEDRIDRAASTHLRTMTFSEAIGLSIDTLTLSLELTQEQVIDVSTDTVLSSGTDVSFTFRPAGTIHEASVKLDTQYDTFDLSASLVVQFSETFSVVFDGSIGWDCADSSDVSFGWGITFDTTFDLPLPFLLSKGRITGRLFIDTNEDGVYNDGDRPAGGAIVTGGGVEVSTDEDGWFRFPPMYPGTATLTARQLPSDAATLSPVDVVVSEGSVVDVALALRPVLTVKGVVFLDTSEDGVQQSTEAGLAGITVVLEALDGTQKTAATDTAGAFEFFDVAPGPVTLSLDVMTLPDRFEYTTAESAEVVARIDGTADTTFGGYIEEREVLITYQPPTADAVYAPSRPTAGEPVTFDGSGSFDFDGSIAAYAWDFDGDALIDSTDAAATWTFDEVGDRAVTLTVTDNAGNSDMLSLIVTVAPSAAADDEKQDTSGSETGDNVQDESGDSTQDVSPDAEHDETADDEPTQTVPDSVLPPLASIDYTPTAPTAGQTVSFDASGSRDFDLDGYLVAYAWDFDGDGETDSTDIATVWTFGSAGTYNVLLAVTDNGGFTDTALAQIQVGKPAATEQDEPEVVAENTPPFADATVTPTAPNAGESVTFDASESFDADGTIEAYAWDFADDGTVDATDPLVMWTFAEAGEYTVRLTITDDQGDTDTIVLAIAVAASDEEPAVEEAETNAEAGDEATSSMPPLADFSYSPTVPVAGEPIEFNGLFSFDFDGSITAYAWDFDADGVIDSTQSVVIHVFGTAGDHKVSLTVDDDGGNQDTVTRTITVE